MNLLVPLAAGLVLLAGCATPTTAPPPQAAANLSPTAGNKVSGLVTFAEKDGVVFADANVTGLTPGRHGIHIHEKGDCSASDASSAGGHFNPHGERHGGTRGRRHAGDLGNLTANASGVARMRVQVEGVTLRSGQPHSIMARAVIVHAEADDFRTQPDGGAGARVACGVIGLGELSPF